MPARRPSRRGGIGLRSAPHLRHVQAERPPVAWFEVHSENYFADGGPALAALDRIRADYPLVVARRRAVARIDRSARPRASRQARRGSSRASSPRSSPSICAGAASAAGTSTTSCRSPTPTKRSSTCARASRKSRTILGRRDRRRERLRRTSPSPSRRCPNGSSSPPSCGGRAASCCSTSTTSTSTPSTTGSTPTPISRRCRGKPSPRSTSPDSTRPAPASSTPTARASRRRSGRSTQRTIARIGPRPTLIEWDVDLPGVRGARSRGRDGRGHARRMPCRRCLSCSGASPTPSCGRRTALGARACSRRTTGAERIGHLSPHDRIELPERARRDLSGRTPARRRAVLPCRRRRLRRGASVALAAISTCTAVTFGDFLAGYPPASEPPLPPRCGAPRMGDRRGQSRGGFARRPGRSCCARWRAYHGDRLPSLRLRMDPVVPAHRIAVSRCCASGR